jgi:hypothetical protein
MTNDTLTAIEEIERIPSPAPEPVGIACDGADIWVASPESCRLYGLRGNTGSVFEEAVVPGTPVGMVVTGDALRVVVGDDDNSRTIRRYVMGHGFKTETLACPDDTGSFLAYDGDNLFLSQRFLKRILELDGLGHVGRTIAVPREIVGMVVVHGRLYLMTTAESGEPVDHRVLRVDARKPDVEIVEIAHVPFIARGLAWDGNKFWTNSRDENMLVAFEAIGTED